MLSRRDFGRLVTAVLAVRATGLYGLGRVQAGTAGVGHSSL